jgi:hypothetical protein
VFIQTDPAWIWLAKDELLSHLDNPNSMLSKQALKSLKIIRLSKQRKLEGVVLVGLTHPTLVALKKV